MHQAGRRLRPRRRGGRRVRRRGRRAPGRHEPTVLLNERLRDALGAATARLAAEPGVRRSADAPAVAGEGFRHQPEAFEAPAAAVAAGSPLLEEHFGPVVLLLRYGDRDELLGALGRIEGQLTGTLHAEPEQDAALLGELTELLAARAGRLIYDGFPTGVAVTHGMHHGGPYPATPPRSTPRWA